MARRVVTAILLLLAMGVAASAEDLKTRIFAGGSYLRDGVTHYPGWQAGIEVPVCPHIGIVGDFAGQYRNGDRFHEYLGGVRASVNRNGLTAFVHGLVGGMTVGVPGGSSSGFAFSPGAGIDIKAGNRFSIRPVQIDLLTGRLGGTWSSDVRIGAGVVFPIGK